MLLFDVVLEWSDRFGDDSGLRKWIDAGPSGLSRTVAPSATARDAIGRFIDMLNEKLPVIEDSRPDIVRWFKGDGKVLVDEAMELARVTTAAELVDVIGLVDELAALVSDTETTEETCFWLVETLAQLRNTMQRLRSEWDAAPRIAVDVTAEVRQWWHISFKGSVEPATTLQPSDNRPATPRPVHFSLAV